MRRHIDFRDHFNLARLGVLDNVDVILAREEAAINLRTLAILRQQAGGFAQVVATLPTDFGQFRQARNGDAPTFVITQMEVEFIELVRRHLVQQAQHRILLVEVTCDIQEDATILEARRIFGLQRSDFGAAFGRH
ncbi:hypothetical protein D3C76_1260180 [compost metagenome]